MADCLVVQGPGAWLHAVALLGLSRPTLVNLVASGEVDNVMVGTHHRIPVEAILAFQRARNLRRNRAAQALAAFSHEMGLERVCIFVPAGWARVGSWLIAMC